MSGLAGPFSFHDTQLRAQGHFHSIDCVDAIGQAESHATVCAAKHIEEARRVRASTAVAPAAFHELEVGVVFVQHSVDAVSFHALPCTT